MYEDLREALHEGDLERVRSLITAGADIRYKREHRYDALLDAVHGRDVMRDPRLLDLLELLRAQGVDRSGVSDYGETGLRVLSRVGRFDAVRLLLDAGADQRHLQWTPLTEAVAIGSLGDVQTALDQGSAIEERDCWSRTAWLLALLTGEIAKAKLLRERGADTNARGHCGTPALFYAVQGHHADVLRWLIEEGADVNQTDEFGATALIEAVQHDDIECVDVLLRAGANVDADAYGTALSRATSRAVILRLLEVGADPTKLSHEGPRIVLGLGPVGDAALDALAIDEIRRHSRRSFGEANPERMRVPFWEAMVRCGACAFEARRRLGEEDSFREPIWCAHRFGQSLTLLPDGRAVQVGGEHEDFYDSDFCIYNDVFIHQPDGSLAIYGYPESVFPPTDFHTATLLGDWIYVIGCLGYAEARRFGETPVHRLNVHTLRMERLEVRGEAPGWIYKHRAEALNPREIRVWGGIVLTSEESEESPNASSFVLNTERLLWRREQGPGGKR